MGVPLWLGCICPDTVYTRIMAFQVGGMLHYRCTTPRRVLATVFFLGISLPCQQVV